MTDYPPIFVIHRTQDEERAEFIKIAYKNAGLSFNFFEATDGHADLANLSIYKALLPNHFWLKDQIKIGAFACFISHYRLWQKIIDEQIEGAIITEDDSAPSETFHEDYLGDYHDADLVFFNNRMSSLAETGESSFFNQVVDKILADKLEFRAPGADGYWISLGGAQKLISFADKHGVFCGVDWAMLAAAWDTRHIKMRDLKNNREMKWIFKTIGIRQNTVSAKIAQVPLFTIERKFKSTLNHSVKVPIKSLKEKF